jgi:PAS domain-containing protein
VLLDIGLPDGNGISVCEQLKEVRPALPVVLISAVYRTANAREDGYAKGADAFLLEPVPAPQLTSTVQRLVQFGPAGDSPIEPFWIMTDGVGDIIDLSPQAAALINVSVRSARGRKLPQFFTDNRVGLMNELRRAYEGLIVNCATTLRPRDRQVVAVHLDIARLYIDGMLQLRWVITPQPAPSAIRSAPRRQRLAP